MSAPDRAGFEKMLADAKSPQEAAYLWKALGAGYNSLADPQSFDQVIHPHGDDPSWLSGHLDPHINNLTQEGKYDLDWGSPEVMDI
ncbi:hypothetical protein ACIHDR_49265 [Nocardia sp. NPDC052278]|uniref:hypothetical protein n=1 Tax=unclassified Nocardia TaxID=2637762 RepID=UPI0036987D12